MATAVPAGSPLDPLAAAVILPCWSTVISALVYDPGVTAVSAMYPAAISVPSHVPAVTIPASVITKFVLVSCISLPVVVSNLATELSTELPRPTTSPVPAEPVEAAVILPY